MDILWTILAGILMLAGMVGIPQLSLIGIVASGVGFGLVYAVRRQIASN